MWGLRQQVSLLIEHHHTQAPSYPIRRVWEETSIVVARTNQMEASRAVILQSAVGSLLNKKGQKAFKSLLKELRSSGQ